MTILPANHAGPTIHRLTERQIQAIMWRELQSRSKIVMPNYTPKCWHECDLWAVTRAGYVQEYEIKVSVRDFVADAEKTDRWRTCTKHGRLTRHDLCGPNQFWFVLPDSVAALVEIPAWAGLIKIVTSTRGRHHVVPASNGPRLHTKHVDEKEIERAKVACYYRYWQERERRDKERHHD